MMVKAVEQNYEKAMGWWKETAQQGQTNARNNLAQAYYEGKHIKKAIY